MNDKKININLEATKVEACSRMLIPYKRRQEGKLIKNESNWQEGKTKKAVHLLKYVNDIILPNGIAEGTLKHLFFSGNRNNIGLPRRLETEIKVKEYYITIGSIDIYEFDTGIGFLDIEIGYSNVNMKLVDIPNAAYILKKVKGRGVKNYSFEEINSNSKNGLFDQLFDEFNDAVFFFYESGEIKYQAFMYHMIGLPVTSNEIQDEKEDLLFHLMRNYSCAYKNTEKTSNTQSEGRYTPYSYIEWAYSQEGIVCIYSFNEERKISDTFQVDTFLGNLKTDYKMMLLLLLHQKFELYYFMAEMLQCKNNENDLKNLQKKFIDFQMRYAFNVISDERTYHHLHTCLKEVFSLKELYADIQDVTNKVILIKEKEENCRLEEEKEERQKEEKRKSKRQDVAILVISILAIVSAFTDSLGGAEKLGAPIYPTCYFIAGVLVLISVIVLCLYFD